MAWNSTPWANSRTWNMALIGKGVDIEAPKIQNMVKIMVFPCWFGRIYNIQPGTESGLSNIKTTAIRAYGPHITTNFFKTTKQLHSRHVCLQKLHDHVWLQILTELPTKEILISQFNQKCVNKMQPCSITHTNYTGTQQAESYKNAYLIE